MDQEDDYGPRGHEKIWRNEVINMNAGKMAN
jgi:hypothetical protein